MRSTLLAILILAIVLGSVGVEAEDLYVSQSGGGNGSSCASPQSAAWFNSSSNWGTGTGKISSGDLVHFCGTITSNMAAQASGTSGSVITIVFDNGARLSQPYFNPSGFGNGILSLNNRSYITVDGGGSGIIELTDNGTSPNYGHQSDGCGISLQGSSNITIHDLTIRNLYVRKSSSDNNGNGYGICNNNGLGGTTRFYNMKISQMSTCWMVDVNGSNEIDHTTCSGVTWGFADFGTHSATHHWFHDNTLTDNAEWYSPSDIFHNDPWHLATMGSTWPDIQIYNNTISGDWSFNTTGWFYFECDNTPTSCPAKIFNNLLIATSSPTNGRIACKDAQGISIYNNYFSGPGNAIHIENGGAGGCSNIVAENNIFNGVGSVYAIGPGPSTYGARDYNDYYNTSQAAVGPHDIKSNPNLNSSFVPNAGSPVIGAGLNLTSLGLPPLNSDKAGVARPSGAAWDIGPYQYPPTGSNPNPPTGLAAQPH